MLFETPFSAANTPSFPSKTLCLTFDDGPSDIGFPPSAPGPHSLKVAQYLASEGVPATFFLVGRCIEQFPGIAEQIVGLGHQVGVHTYDHLPLDDYVKAGGDVVRQIALTGALLPRSVDSPFYLRPPYGSWSAAVAQAMNADFFTALNCFGPIQWDNSNSSDWDKWQDGVAPRTVAQSYLDDITAMGKGVILMHDNSADKLWLRKRNMGLPFVKILIPLLKSAGFNMVRVDEIAGFAAEAANSSAMALRGANQMYISVEGGGGGAVLVNANAAGATEKLSAVALGGNRYALRAPGGQYLSVQNTGDNPVTATAPEVGDLEVFEAMPWRPGVTAFRNYTGGFFTIAADARLLGNGWPPQDNNVGFTPWWYPAAAAASGGTP